MSILELILTAIGLAMDAFAVSICKGLSLGKINKKHMITAGLWFGSFQALMPVLGYLVGSWLAVFVDRYSHWVVFVLLGMIGIGMIRESRDKEKPAEPSMAPGTMLVLALATSMDALAVGASFALLKVKIVPAALLIGCITFIISAAGVKTGSLFGDKYRSRAELAGGAVLVLIGLKILLEGLGVI